MTRFLKKAVDVREGETRRALIMASYIFVIIASYNVLKPMTRSLFVTNLGPNQLPLLYILLAGTVGIFVVFYLRWTSHVRLDRLINFTTFFLIANLLLFWLLLKSAFISTTLYYLLFIWVSIYGVLTTTQFWLLANCLFDTREAKRLFPFLTAFGLLGAIMGGYFTRLLVRQLGGTANLAFFAMGLLLAAVVLMNLAWRYRTEAVETKRKKPRQSELNQSFQVVAEVFSLIRNSRHLRFLIGIIGITFMVVQIADFQFIAFASEKYAETDVLTGFLGVWLSNLSIIALIFQAVFAGAVIRRFGVGATILFLPITMLLCSAWVLFGYGLTSILALKIGDGSFRHSINKVGIELLYLPIPTEIKQKTKAFIDMFADRIARGVAGVLLLIFYSYFGLSVAQIGVLSLVLILVWLVLTFATYKEYVNSFRQALARRSIDADLLTVSIKDTKTIDTLIEYLKSENERQVVYALQLLESVDSKELVPQLRPLLSHSASDVRLHALQLLNQLGDSRLLPDIQKMLHDEEELVRREALRFYARFSTDSITEMLTNCLNDEDCELRGAALYFLAERSELAAQMLTPELIESILQEGKNGKLMVADALGLLNDRKYFPFMEQLLTDLDAEVKTRAIKSVGQTCAREFLPQLIQCLDEGEFRKAAREALIEYGEDILPEMARILDDEKASHKIQTGVIRVLGLVGSQKSVDFLLDKLLQETNVFRYQIIKALNKLRANFPELKFDQRVDRAIQVELKKYFTTQLALNNTLLQNGESDDQDGLLQRALRERVDDHVERIFRLLGLRFPARDIYNAYASMTSSSRTVRANAVEFLDNILPNNLKRVLLLIVDELPLEKVLQQTNGFVEVNISSRQQALEFLISEKDAWIKACAIYEIGKSQMKEHFRKQIEMAQRDNNKLVQETARFVLEKL
ncbi:MAG: Npt1/Npt2 family nucleotide transporter [bacterium]